MRFLLLNQFFVPDLAPTGRLLADLAEEIAARGHSVTVVCARSAYAGAAPAALPSPDAGRIRVLRAPSLPFRRSHAARLLSYLSFYAGALWLSLRVSKPDVVVTMTTPPLLSLIGAMLHKIRGARHYVWEMDMYPDIAVALGVLRADSPLTRVLGAIARYCRRHADAVIVLGPCMRARVLHQGVPPDRVHIVDNWADGALIRPRPAPPPEPLVALYSGNLGLAHDIDTIAAAMYELREDRRFRFVFAGGGALRPQLEQRCRANGIANVSWMPYQDWDSLPAHLAACHIGLVTQTPASLGTLVPGKIYALLAAGRPILFIGPREATAAQIVKQYGCGWQLEPGDSDGLVALLRLLASSPQLATEAGARARRTFVERYDLPLGVAGVLNVVARKTPDDASGPEKEPPLGRLIPMETPCARRCSWGSPPWPSR